MILRDDAAFAALRRLLRSGEGTDWRAPENPAFDRLRRAWVDDRTSTLELAVLLRQALRNESVRQGAGASFALSSASPLQSFERWDEVGLLAEDLPDGVLVSAKPWVPAWGNPAGEPFDTLAVSEARRPSAETSACAGDPFLETLRHATYQSVGQRAAVRSALTTPRGATLAVALATGEGKSLIFQLAAKLGFAGDQAGEGGLVLVVVPTVALAIDHENAAIEKGLEGPIAYRSGSSENNLALIAHIDADALPLCVASPEAVCGPLRRSLTAAAARGRLRALVIDEAHLVDSWGTGFRTEFQTLSGLRHQWVQAAPDGMAARTLLLSATLTPVCLVLLRTLFSGPGPFQTLSALRLRGEPDYRSVTCATAAEREDRVLEAIRHAPRPAILYATRVVDAKDWAEKLRNDGFSRLELVHGETGAAERDRILTAWRAGAVDLVVATSAFGLGIDYPHVRTILHACVPESLDRYYQEVGRGGRDGRFSLALALHTPQDLAVARRISEALVISIRRGRQRWSAMYQQRIPTETPDTYIVPLDVAPSSEPEDIDMRGERNSDWNARVLTLMARAGLVRLLGEPASAVERVGRHETVQILDLEHAQEGAWRRHVEPIRRDLTRAGSANLNLMQRFLATRECPAPLLLDLYGAGIEAHACSRCAACRTDPAKHRPERPRLEPKPPWPASHGLAAHLREHLDANRRLIIWYDPGRSDRVFRRRLGDIVRTLQGQGFANVVLLGTSRRLSEDIRTGCREAPVFLAEVERLTQRRLPAGPELVFVGENTQLSALDLAPRQEGAEQFLFLPLSQEDATRPGVALIKTYAGRSQAFEAFFGNVYA